MNNEIVVNATRGILGRIASYVAKQALLGKKVVVVNCNDALVTGDKKGVVERYRVLRAKGGSSLKGPKVSKMPERFMKRCIRGMLSHKQSRGRDALKRVMCYNSVPLEKEGVEMIDMKRELKVKATKLKEVSEALGWNIKKC